MDAFSRPLIQRRIDQVVIKLRRRRLIGSHNVAVEVVRLLREVVAGAKFSTFDILIDRLWEIGGKLEQAQPKELVIGNIIKRVIKFLREEYNTALQASRPLNTPMPGTPETFAVTPAGVSSETNAAATDFFSANAHRQLLPSSRHPGLPSSASTFSIHSASQYNAPMGVHSIFDLLGHRGSTPLSSTWGDKNISSPTATPPSEAFSPVNSPVLSRVPSTLYLRSRGDGSASPAELEFSKKSHSLKPLFIDAITELMDELETVHENVASSAAEHIHNEEIILTLGHSRTVEAFFRAAARKRKFTVIVAETAPSLSGRSLALNLSKAGIDTVLIPDACVFALMRKCSKVVLPAHIVLADGSLLSTSGSLLVARAAKAHLVPTVCCTGMYKFSPIFLGADYSMADFGLSTEVLSLDVTAHDDGASPLGLKADYEVLNPRYDRVPADLINLFITNLGAYPASMCYRLLTDMYGTI